MDLGSDLPPSKMFSYAEHAIGSDVKHQARKLVLSNDVNSENTVKLKQIVEEYALVIFSKKECCMAHATRTMLLRMGANPLVLEVDDLDHLRRELSKIVVFGDMYEGMLFPIVFIGGRLIGGPEKIVSMHVCEELVPMLKEAGALWL